MKRRKIDMNITVKVTNNYGSKAVYPVCRAGKMFAMIAGTVTLTDPTIALIKQLGYEVQVAQETL
jgi:hypothetical protein